MRDDINEIHRQTKRKEDQNPDYAEDLAVKRAEGVRYEQAISAAFNSVSKTARLRLHKDHEDKDAVGFFTSFDADLFLLEDGQVFTTQCELKGRTQWGRGPFRFPTIIINANKVDEAGPRSLLVYCNRHCDQFFWTWDLTRLKKFPTREFRINKRGDIQLNLVYDIPVSYLSRRIETLASFVDNRRWETL